MKFCKWCHIEYFSCSCTPGLKNRLAICQAAREKTERQLASVTERAEAAEAERDRWKRHVEWLIEAVNSVDAQHILIRGYSCLGEAASEQISAILKEVGE